MYIQRNKNKNIFYVMANMASPFPPGIHIQGNEHKEQVSCPVNNITNQQVQPSSKKRYCTNCGDMTHTSKDCKDPIMSCGIILYRRLPTNEFQYLMICRRNTIGLVEIIRGRYDVSDLNYIRSLVNVMSQQEVQWVRTKTFDDLWKIVWREHADNFIKEKKISEEKYIQVYSFIQETLDSLSITYSEPEWGFPKGRRNYKESHLMAAIRELKEETSISPHNYVLHNNAMFEESYVSYDGKHYKNIYYIGCLRDYFDIEDIMRVHRIQTTSYEISSMKLLSLNECLTHIRDYNSEKKSMLMEIDHFLHTTHYNNPNQIQHVENQNRLHIQTHYSPYPYNNINSMSSGYYNRPNGRQDYGQYKGYQSGYYTNANQSQSIPPHSQSYRKKYPHHSINKQNTYQHNTSSSPNHNQYMSHLQ